MPPGLNGTPDSLLDGEAGGSALLLDAVLVGGDVATWSIVVGSGSDGKLAAIRNSSIEKTLSFFFSGRRRWLGLVFAVARSEQLALSRGRRRVSWTEEEDSATQTCSEIRDAGS